ncbi:hypothetical protein EYC59_01795 [Candidatus Saccharibacteria bacterium]|nr:MAG: hypothetical protein EYC59_01795 [Candidatus Saccharibacteria bacterium]
MDPSYRGRVPQVPYSSRQSGGRFRLQPRTLVIALVLIVVVIIGFVLLSQSGDKSGPLQQHLSARLATLQKMTDEGEKNLKSSDLRELNARLRIQLSSDTKSLGDSFTETKPDKTITANEADTASFNSLKEAQLNSRFDDSYRTLIAHKLDSTTLLMKELYGKTQSKKLKDALNNAYKNFKQLEDQLTTNS